MTDYRVIPTSVILTFVRLYDETLIHVADEHKEIGEVFPLLPSAEHAVVTAISSPWVVEQSRPDALVYVDMETTNYAGEPLRIPVKIIEGTLGLVKTFYFASSSSNANVVYRRDNG